MFYFREIHIGGHSAGAHLAAELFEFFIPNLPQDDKNLFKNVFLISGIYNLVPLVKTSVNIPLKLDENSAKTASPLLKKIAGGETTFYVIVAEQDSPPFIEQAKEMHQHLNNSGAKSEYIYLKDIDHFDIVEKLYDETFKLTCIIVDNIITK